MEVLRYPGQDILMPSCVILGNFDGVHLGHMVLIDECIQFAKRHGLVSTVMSFERHTSREKLLSTPEEKQELIAALGPDRLIILEYDEVKDWIPRKFLDFLRDEAGAKHLVSGPDHRFGRYGAGSPAMILEEVERWEMGLTVLPPLRFRGVFVKSGFVRGLIRSGEVEEAAYYLGYHYPVQGKVVEGRGIGSDIGFPTANLLPPKEKLLPADGVYAVTADGMPAVCHIGPRFPDGDFGFEVHILDFVGDITGRAIRVVFHKRLRDTMQFRDSGDLRDHISADVARAREYFSRV
ncbi:MAG: bifunctional riboflavin kinase/FMN adenylyltransferase [candidate division WOR-3 bacterium]